MKFTNAGHILFTEKYEECVDFYGERLELELMHEIDRDGEQLTTFSLGGTYLMVERGGVAHVNVKRVDACPTKLRFNVPDVETACETLRDKGIDIEIVRHDWGTTAEFSDPDGNPCALRSDDGFGE